MIRLIIVEDETVIRNGIHRHVSWDKLEIQEVKTSANAEEALEMCKNFKPDIIISDIRMPGMNGVELCKLFKELLPQVQTIFISGFSDKEYLMAAISLGAVSYVEKPIDIEVLSEAIEKAVTTVKRLRNQQKNIIHSLIRPIDDSVQDNHHTLLQMMECKKMEKDHFFFVIQMKVHRQISLKETFSKRFQDCLDSIENSMEVHILDDFISKESLLILVSGETLEKRGEDFPSIIMDQILQIRQEEEQWFLAAGLMVSNIQELPKAFDTAEETLKSLAYKGWNQAAAYKDKQFEYDELMIEPKAQNHFLKLLSEHKLAESIAILDEIYQNLIEKNAILNFNIRNVYYQLNSIVTEAKKNMGINCQEYLKEEKGQPFLDSAQTIFEMHEYVINHVKQMLEEGDEEQKSHFIIKKTIDNIHQNLDRKDISIQILADMVYLTPTYLSSLFKKSTGATMNQFLTEARMKKAEELLKDPKLKLYHIAELIGYEDPNYFAKLFKKHTGMLPSEYREKKLL